MPPLPTPAPTPPPPSPGARHDSMVIAVRNNQECLGTWHGLPGAPHVPSSVVAHILAYIANDLDTICTALEALDYDSDSFDLWAYIIVWSTHRRRWPSRAGALRVTRRRPPTRGARTPQCRRSPPWTGGLSRARRRPPMTPASRSSAPARGAIAPPRGATRAVQSRVDTRGR